MAKGTRTLTLQDQRDAVHFRERLQQLIDARGLTAAGLAKKAGTTPRTLYRILQEDADPTRSTLVAIARALEVSIDALAVGEPTSSDATLNEYVTFSSRVLAMAYPQSVDCLDEDERTAIAVAIGDVLQAVIKSPVPPRSINMAYLPLARAAVSALTQLVGRDLEACAIDGVQPAPLSSACMKLDRADWETKKQSGGR